MEKIEGKEGIALSIVNTWAFFPFESKNLFTHLLTRTASPLNVSFCVVSSLGSVLTVTYSGTPSPIALAFLCQPHCANLYPSLVSKYNLLCLVLLRLCIAKKTLSPGLLFSPFDPPRFYFPFVSDATLCIRKSGKIGKMQSFMLNNKRLMYPCPVIDINDKFMSSSE